MGSLNGDVTVMRNGRSTSQVSVYNYPEHLNPFYEDDQHKRLRFWKISKKDNEGRRNSFSIGNLKDMWAFKSFRLKKKSSTLGITKTSESPPPLRRDYVLDNGWNSFDHRLRDSTPVNGDSFQRNVNYRSSLQNLPYNNDRGAFNRNEDYRSTIQVPRQNPRFHPQNKKPQLQPRRYVYGGSVTPQPLRNTNIGSGPYESYQNNPMMRGSSQNSLASTNPFESDLEDENEDVDAMHNISGSSTTLSKSTPRKKRRAPAPPTPIRGQRDTSDIPYIAIESSQNDTQSDLCIREDTDIANLTAEIESFVKTKSNEDVQTTPLKEHKETVSKSENKVDDTTTILKTQTTITTNTKEITIVPASKAAEESVTNVKIHPVNQEKAPTTNGHLKSVAEREVAKETTVSNGAIPKKINQNTVHTATPQLTNSDLRIEESLEASQAPPTPIKRASKTATTEVGQVECIHVHVESPRATPRNEQVNRVSSFRKEHQEEDVITTKTPFVLTSPPRQRRSTQQTELTTEPVKVEHEPVPMNSNKVNVNGEKTTTNATKPEIMIKPTLSPKPRIDKHEKSVVFAEIHKPIMGKTTNTANGHVKRASRDEIVTPPTIPQQQEHKQREVKENGVVAQHSELRTASNQGESMPASQQNVQNQHIEETIVIKTTITQPVQQKVVENQNVLKQTEMSKTNLEIREELPSSPRQQREITSITSHSQPSTVSASSEINSPTNDNSEFDSLLRNQPPPPSHMEWKHSTLAPLETNIPPEKRKSVKDIIESINRSQRLLHAAANKDFTIISSPPARSSDNDSCDEDNNLRILDQSQREMQRIVQRIENLDNEAAAGAPPSYHECVTAQKLDNSEIFQKCKVSKEVYDYRDTSPTSSNLDWNPVPKPKRTKPQNE